MDPPASIRVEGTVKGDSIDDGVCIVGMACHLPGGIMSPSALWDFLMAGKSAQGPVPPGRYNVAGFFRSTEDGGSTRPGVMPVSGGYFLQDDVRKLDNNFFGINNLECTYMDPQQRKLLEVVFQCFEHAGVTLDQVSGTSTGVYVGSFTVDYQTMQTREPDTMHRFTATGAGTTILANRISHVFNLHGPSMSIDTACSSSLYALHHAASAIKLGDCDSAVVAGVNLILGPEQMLGTSKAGVLSPTSTCHTFDAAADGYGRGEGVNAVLLKRLSAARRDGDKIWAVVRGSAVNANGATPGITQPSSDLQEEVIRKAYANAKLDPAGTPYVECHGTGTPVGDPIEVEAVSRCLSRPVGMPALLIGSSKPNLGHSEAASGLTAVIKMAMALDRQEIPPTIGVKKVNPNLKLDSRNIKVLDRGTKWPSQSRDPRRVSINSFGYGGANAHVILESLDSCDPGEVFRRTPGSHSNTISASHHPVEALYPESCTPFSMSKGPRQNAATVVEPVSKIYAVPVSAASPLSLQDRVRQTKDILSSSRENLEELVLALGEKRTHFQGARDVILVDAGFPPGVDSTIQPREIRFIEHEISQNASNVSTSGGNPALEGTSEFVFVFTGQGAQYPGMARELMLLNQDMAAASNATKSTPMSFKSTIRFLDSVLQGLPKTQAPAWTIEQTLIDTDPDISLRIHDVTRSQPVTTAIQIALVDMLASWGVRPAKVVGHSSGEIAAAYAAGLLSAEEAIMVAYLRGYAVGMVNQETAGAMLAAGIGIETAEGLVRDLGLTELVTIGCVNSPQSVTLSGSKEGIETLSRELEGRGKFSRVLRTGGRAYHSSMMRAAAELYEELLAPILRLGANVEKVSEPHAATMISTSSCLPDLESPSSRKMVSVGRQMASSAKYWRSNLEQPVQFQAATEQILTSSAKSQWVEIGPHPVLKGPIEQTRARRDNAEGRKTQPWTYMGTLRRKEDARFATKTLAGSLFLRGYSLRWPCVNDMDRQNHHGMMAPDVHTLLPMYPWDYSEGILWHEPRASAEIRAKSYPCHELLGSRQVAGNEINFSWRKVLQLQGEADWLRDHKVGSQIVFPAAGYLAMIIEAFNQIAATLPEGQVQVHELRPRPGVEAVEFRDVKISSALVIPDDGEGWNQGERIELHTQISRRMLSASTFSDHWYDFTISSLIWTGASASGSTLHCAGRIRSTPRTTGLTKVTSLQNALSMDMKDWATWPDNAGWYDEMEQEGLCYGPSFRVIKKVQSPRTKTRTGESISRTGPVSSHLVQSGQYYPVHPIHLDACLQTAMLSSCAGDPHSIRAYLPEAIDRCLVRIPANHDKRHGNADLGSGRNYTGEAILYSRVMGTGVFTARLDCVLVDAVPRGTGAQSPIIEFQSVRITEYSAKVKTDPIVSVHQGQDGRDATHARHPRLPRQPCLRIVWKPDISYVPHEERNNSVSDASSSMTEVATAEGNSGDAFADHIASFVRAYNKLDKEGEAGRSCSEGVRCPESGLNRDATFIAALGGIIDLAGHKNPYMRVLEITDVLTYNTKAMEKSLHNGIGEKQGPPKVNDNPERNWWLSQILGRDSGFQRYKEWRVGRLILSSDEGGKVNELEMGLEFTDNGQDNKNKQPFDLILFPNPVAGWQNLFLADPRDADDGDHDKYPILRLVARGGVVIGASSSADGGVSLLRPRCFGQAALSAPSSGNKTLLLAEEKVTDDDNLEFFNFIILTREEAANVTHAASFAFIRVFMEHVSCAFGQRATVETVPFNSEAPSRINPPSHAARVVCISLLELEQQFLASMAQPELITLQEILDSVGSLLWVTGADMLSSTGDMNPDLTLSSGLCRSLAIEQPTLGFTVVDIGDALHQIRTTLATGREKDEYTSAAGKSHKSLFSAARTIVDIARRRAEDNVEKELIWHQGRLHISRFVPDSSDINAIFCRRLGISSPECPIIQPTSLSSVCRQSSPLATASAKLALARGAGIIEGLHYEQVVEPKPAVLLPTTSTTPTVTIQVLAVGLNAKDVYSLHGRVESTPPDPRHQGTPSMLDYTGVITSISFPEQCELQIGDRVLVGVYPTPFATTVSEIPASAVHKLLPRENAAELATLPVVYATALYGLRDIGRVRPEQDTVLIHCGAGSLGIAALTIAARVLGVHPTRMFATAGTESKRRYIVETFGLPRENVMDSRDMASFVEGIKIQTGGAGVDVILNSLAGDLMHAGWESCLAPFGRFIEVGKRDLVDAGRLDMRVLEKGASFSAFDMAVLGLWRPDSSDKGGPGTVTGTGRSLLRNLINETLGLYRQGAITAIPSTIFQADEIAKAYRHFSSPERVGKVVISFENDKVSVPLALSRYWSVLDPEKVYLIVGGLGGLGRSLSRWMVSRGARNFVFLGRTGCDKPNAEQMVRELRESVLGVRVHVVRGDVANPSHVEDAMAACRATGCALGGVIQAAMALKESLFSHMSADSWQTAVFPKWAGTWNLHNALSALPHSDEEKADGFFFLLLSSVSGSVGTATESNYCAANGFLDAFAKWRRSQGRPATSIGLGMISEVGYLHENPQIEALLLRRGIQPLKESEFLQIMDLALSQPLPSATPSSYEPDLEAVMKGWAAAHLLTGLEPFETLRLQQEGFDVRLEVMNDPRASILAVAMEQASAAATSSKRPLGETTSTKDFAPWFASLLLSSQNRKAMDALMTEADASSLHVAVSSLALRRFATLMLTPIAKVAVDRPLARFGVDSMTAAEFRTWFWNSLHIDVPFLDLMSPRKSLADIVCFVVRELEASSSEGS